jgi:hypothetical protein
VSGAEGVKAFAVFGEAPARLTLLDLRGHPSPAGEKFPGPSAEAHSHPNDGAALCQAERRGSLGGAGPGSAGASPGRVSGRADGM